MQIRSMQFKPRLRGLVVKNTKELVLKGKRGGRSTKLHRDTGRADAKLRKF